MTSTENSRTMTDDNNNNGNGGGNGTRLDGIAAILDSGLLKIGLIAGLLYIAWAGVPTISIQVDGVQYVKWLVVGSIVGGPLVVIISNWIRAHLIDDTRSVFIELDDAGEEIGKVYVNLMEVDVEILENSMGRRKPKSPAEPYSGIYLVREIEEIDWEEKRIEVTGILDWDDLPEVDQRIADKTELKQYRKTTEENAKEGRMLRKSLPGIVDNIKRSVVQEFTVMFETASGGVIDTERTLGDTVSEYEALQNDDMLDTSSVVDEAVEEATDDDTEVLDAGGDSE